MGARSHAVMQDNDALVLVKESFHQLEGLHDLLTETTNPQLGACSALQLCAMLRPTLAYLDQAAELMREGEKMGE